MKLGKISDLIQELRTTQNDFEILFDKLADSKEIDWREILDKESECLLLSEKSQSIINQILFFVMLKYKQDGKDIKFIKILLLIHFLLLFLAFVLPLTSFSLIFVNDFLMLKKIKQSRNWSQELININNEVAQIINEINITRDNCISFLEEKKERNLPKISYAYELIVAYLEKGIFDCEDPEIIFLVIKMLQASLNSQENDLFTLLTMLKQSETQNLNLEPNEETKNEELKSPETKSKENNLKRILQRKKEN